jgi:hypothetical protein
MPFYFIAAGAAVILLLAAVVLLSPSRRPTPRRPVPPPTVVKVRRDWYGVGYSRGADWARVTQIRHGGVPPRAEVEQIADMMTSDYRDITPTGEDRFKRGFIEAALQR